MSQQPQTPEQPASDTAAPAQPHPSLGDPAISAEHTAPIPTPLTDVTDPGAGTEHTAPLPPYVPPAAEQPAAPSPYAAPATTTPPAATPTATPTASATTAATASAAPPPAPPAPSYYEASVPPYPPPAPAPAMPAPRRRRKLTAAAVVTALVLGAGAGIGGTLLATSGDDSAPSTTSSDTVQSPVVTKDDDTAPAAGSAESVAAAVLPSVVKINIANQRGSGSGSGVILSSDGEILTNNHVVEGYGPGSTLTVNFNDGTTARATVIGTDPLTDLAVIKAEGVSGLTPATLNSADSVNVGESVLAVGSPFGLEATVTSGIVSALNRPVTVSSGPAASQDTTYPAIQTDAAINPGNSGGPLVNMRGEVIGINSSIRSTSNSMGESGSIGLGFAIPISKVLPIIEQLRAGETATHARIGVTVGDVTSGDLTSGAQIASVSAGSAAEKAGIEAGDIVTKVDDELISSTESLIATIRGYRPGDTVTITVVRGGTTHELQATLDSDGGQVSS